MKKILMSMAVVGLLLLMATSLPFAQTREQVSTLFEEATTLRKKAHTKLDLESALEKYSQAAELLKHIGDHKALRVVLFAMAQVYFSLSQYEKALELFQQSLAIANELGDGAGEAGCLNYMSVVYERLGRSQKALELHEQALAIRRKIGDLAGEGRSLANMANVYQRLGQRQKGLELYEQALSISRKNRRPGWGGYHP